MPETVNGPLRRHFRRDAYDVYDPRPQQKQHRGKARQLATQYHPACPEEGHTRNREQ
jgi:hypothetical protein